MSSPDTLAIASPDAQPVSFNFENTYARLPERFYARLSPMPVPNPRLVKVNEALARSLRLDPEALTSPDGVAILAGNRVAEGSEPLAIAYAGHQFGHFVPRLGDGRANLLGEVVGLDGARYDVQLKGSGPTPFSRGGDGRAALGPVLREYLVSEAMAALDVPTTRALTAVTTGEWVLRETALPGAVLTRVAASHLRVGTFQYFAALGDMEGLRRLAEYAIARHYPEAAQAAQPRHALLAGVIGRHARLVAQWMLLGFVHGVMNTDNTSISGETIDYGPCAFLEAYEPGKVFSSIDRHGRYAYGKQPLAALWNLTRLAEAMLPVLAEEAAGEDAAVESAKEALAAFQPQFEAAHLAGLRRKLGLVTEQDGDQALAEELLGLMAAGGTDFTLTFRRLCDAAEGAQGGRGVRALFAVPDRSDGQRESGLGTGTGAWDDWAARWRQRLREDGPMTGEARPAAMRLVNPLFIPRNHLVQAAIDAAVDGGDFGPFEELLAVLLSPFDESPRRERYAIPALPEECVSQTFCGT